MSMYHCHPCLEVQVASVSLFQKLGSQSCQHLYTWKQKEWTLSILASGCHLADVAGCSHLIVSFDCDMAFQ